MSAVGDQVAVYGAVTGTVSLLVGGAALGWQVYSWRRSRKTVVEVKVSMGFLTFGPRLQQAVILTAINHSEYPVRVTFTGILAQDGSDNVLTMIAPPPGSELPGEIPPRDSRRTWYEPGDLAIDVFRPVIGQVSLGSGKTINSKARPLMKRDG